MEIIPAGRVARAEAGGPDPATVTAVVGVAGPVNRLACSPDGRLLAVARGRAVEICDGETGLPMRLLRGHSDRVSELSFSPAGELLAVLWADGLLRVWESATGVERPAPLPGDRARAITFAPDVPLLAVAATRGVLLWPATTGAGRWLPDGPQADVLAFHPDGTLLAAVDSGSASGRVYEVASGRVRCRLRQPWLSWPTGAAETIGAGFAPRDDSLFTVTRDGTVHTWDTRSGWLRETDTAGRDPGATIGAVHFTHWGTSYVTHAAGPDSGSTTRQARFASTTRWGPIERRWHSMPTSAVASNRSGRVSAAGTSGGDLYVWPSRSRPYIRRGRPVRPMSDLAFAPDGSYLAVVEPGGWVLVWHLPSGTVHLSIPGMPDSDGNGVTASAPARSRVAFTSDGSGVVVATAQHPARIHDLSTGRVREGEPAPGIPTAGPAGATPPAGADLADLAGAGAAGAVGSPVARLGDAVAPPGVGPGQSVGSGPVAVSPDGRLRVTSGPDGTVRLSDAATGAVGHELIGHFDRVPTAAFSPDGGRLATASLDGTIRIWATETGAPQVTLVPLPHGLGAALFADGSYAADGEVPDGLWWVAGLRRFAPGRLDQYVPGLRGRPPEPAHAGGVNSSVRALLATLVGHRRAGRARLVAAWAAEQRGADSFAEQVRRLAHCEPEGRFLALIAAGVGECTGYLTEALSDYHPKLWLRALRASRPVDDRVVARAVLAAPAALRREAYRIIRMSGRRDLAGLLISGMRPRG